MIPQKDKDSVESEYKLNEKIVTALENTMSGALAQTALKVED